ncbi:MAG: hypothetical protein EOP35_23915, partial [Rubrivivax sp.]
YQVGDSVVATASSRSTPCVLTLTTLAAAPVGNAVSVSFGIAGAANGTLYNLGRTPRFVAYAVRSGSLTACDLQVQNCAVDAPDNWTEVADNIVSLRAEYAINNSAIRNFIADSYGQTVPTAAFGATCSWSRVVGLRLVLVARSRQVEKEAVDAPAPTWSAGASTPITLKDGWQNYRYKTFETTVPQRNLLVSIPGCGP